MGIITNKIYIYTSSEKNVVDNIDWNGLLTEEYNSKTYYKIPSGGYSSDVVKKITFETLKDNVTVTLNIVSSSERSFDFAYACDLDGNSGYSNAKYMISGNNQSITHEYIVPNKGSHWIYIGYRKDSSGDHYNDCGYFNIDLPEEKVIFNEFKQPNKVYLSSKKMKEITYGNKKVLESGFNNTISWESLLWDKSNNSYNYNSKKAIEIKYKNLGSSTQSSTYLMDSPFTIPNNGQIDNLTFTDTISYTSSINVMPYKIDLSNWDSSYVTDMNSMFEHCNSIVFIDVSELNTNNVINMKNMFYMDTWGKVSGLKSLNVSNWNVSNVTNMYGMFNGCISLGSLDVSNWNVSNVTDMNSMFYHCGSLTSLDVSNWNVSNVTNMYDMFAWCSSLTSLDVSNWNVSNVTNMYWMFGGCSSLTSLDVSNWNVSNVNDISNMFYDCNSLTSLKLFDLSKLTRITDINKLFMGCKKLIEVDLSGLDTSNFKYKYDSNGYEPLEAFYGCASLERICPDEKINENPNFAVFKGLKDNVDLSSCSKMSLNSVYAIINSMTNITTSKTLKLNYVTYNKLSPEWIKKATDKGWSVTK